MSARPIVTVLVLSVLLCSKAYSQPDYNKLADAIYKAENSKTFPYGILKRYKHTSPRQACINTCKHAYRDWVFAGNPGTFLNFLQSRYAPINASNDPTGLNRNWLSNVRGFYETSPR